MHTNYHVHSLEKAIMNNTSDEVEDLLADFLTGYADFTLLTIPQQQKVIKTAQQINDLCSSRELAGRIEEAKVAADFLKAQDPVDKRLIQLFENRVKKLSTIKVPLEDK